MMWLDRDTVRAPFMTMCLSEQEYLAVAAHCEVAHPDRWLDEARQVACVHTWEQGGSLTCVVCLHPDALIAVDPIQVAGTLVHEAVHIFQRLCDSIGESQPSNEFEAYSIERISGELMREFARRLAEHRKQLDNSEK